VDRRLAPNVLIDGRVDLGALPYEIPDNWRFELTRSWQSGVYRAI
jgi:hypothetical protein